MTKILLMGLGRWGANHARVLKSLALELFVTDVGSSRLEVARKAGVPKSHLSTNYKDFAALASDQSRLGKNRSPMAGPDTIRCACSKPRWNRRGLAAAF